MKSHCTILQDTYVYGTWAVRELDLRADESLRPHDVDTLQHAGRSFKLISQRNTRGRVE
jgi:hypothetical protein